MSMRAAVVGAATFAYRHIATAPVTVRVISAPSVTRNRI